MMWNLFRRLFIAIGILGFFVYMGSCSSPYRPNEGTPPELPSVGSESKAIGDASKVIGDISKDVGARADKIDTHVDSASNLAPPETKKLIQPDLNNIKVETKGLRADQATLDATAQKLKDTEARLLEEQKKIEGYTDFAKNSEAERAKLEAKIKDLQSSNAKLLKTLLAWVTVCCVVGIGASLVIGFLFKTPYALIIAAGCLATLGVSVAVTMYLQSIAIVSLIALGIGFLGAIAYVVYQIINKNKAVKELVHTGEVIKPYLTEEAKAKIFGNGAEPGLAFQIQSTSTEKIVSDVRNQPKTKRGFALSTTPTEAVHSKEGVDLISATKNTKQ